MNLDFTEEQKMLRDQARSFLSDKSPLSTNKRILESDEPFDRELWQQVVGLGWTATTIPEKYGGLGLGHLELCVMAEELGRSLAPTPFSSSVYLATEALLRYGSEAQKEKYLPGLADGSLIGSMALVESAGDLSADKIQSVLTGDTLRGSKVMVPDGTVADFLVVLAKGKDGLSLALVDTKHDSVQTRLMNSVDDSRGHARVIFADTPAELLGGAGDGAALTEDLLNRAAVLFAFEQVGGSEAAMEMSRNFAMERYTFGRPIGSYQAVKHKIAWMYVRNVLAKSNCYYAAWALSTDAPELPAAAATARVSAIEAFRYASEENIETHGGNGFTWEFDCHLFYRRSKLLSVNLGSHLVWKQKLMDRLLADESIAAV